MNYNVKVGSSENEYKVIVGVNSDYQTKVQNSLDYKIITGFDADYNTKVSEDLNNKVTFAYNLEVMPQRLDELLDVEIEEVNGEQNNYVLVYNSTTQTWQSVNPDVVLAAASTEPIQPGLPADFIDQTEDQINMDGGFF